MRFEWDEAKRRVDLVRAQALFDGRPVFTASSTHLDAPRYLITGVLDGRFSTVVWTRQKNERTVRYTADELAAMRQRGEGRTDHAWLEAPTEGELGASIDRAEEGELDWDAVQVGIPGPKRQLTVRFDADVVDWFKAQGAGYQTQMNAVLRSYLEAQKKRVATPPAAR